MYANRLARGRCENGGVGDLQAIRLLEQSSTSRGEFELDPRGSGGVESCVCAGEDDERLAMSRMLVPQRPEDT